MQMRYYMREEARYSIDDFALPLRFHAMEHRRFIKMLRII